MIEFFDDFQFSRHKFRDEIFGRFLLADDFAGVLFRGASVSVAQFGQLDFSVGSLTFIIGQLKKVSVDKVIHSLQCVMHLMAYSA